MCYQWVLSLIVDQVMAYSLFYLVLFWHVVWSQMSDVHYVLYMVITRKHLPHIRHWISLVLLILETIVLKTWFKNRKTSNICSKYLFISYDYDLNYSFLGNIPDDS